ncbi:MAG TPA: patatin-like phospholipase family protein, partial [Candidatus Limnocylindrales bacterium]|nr:patatin-like phospholipase family protein [Candidatus Limnocylindrales bacterium]
PLGVKLQYAYLVRVPILVGITLFALPIVSLFALRQLLGNLFLLGPWNILWTMVATTTLAFSILVVFRVVLLNGQERFGIQQALTQDIVSHRALLFTESLALPMLIATVFSNGQAHNALGLRLGAALTGIVAVHVAGYGALWLTVLLSPRYHIPAENRYPVYFAFLRRWLAWAYRHDVVSPEKRQQLGDWGRGLPGGLRAGYFDPRTGLLYPGQWLSFIMLLCTIALYLILGWFKHARLGQQFGVPAIAYVILLLMLLNWSLAIAAFFLDRYRVPLLFLLVVFVAISNLYSKSDHFYELRPASTIGAVNPAQVLTAPSRLAPDADHPRGRVIVIATAGGGIQAAAWTAQVLTGLQAELRSGSPDKPVNFADSIALISSVSGGAVGTMYFVNRYHADSQPYGFTAMDSELPGIVEAAEKPSLDDIAWAMVYPDLSRIFLPYIKSEKDKLIDRGWALEEGWRSRGPITANLSEWRQGIQEGWRPAVIFNATLVESGEPLLLATTNLLQKNQIDGPQRKTFAQLFPNNDIPVVTAVRLAATFPFVTPAARAIADGPQYHVVDGGYYDNYGVNSLLEWLSQAFASTPPEKRPDMLIIQIRSFPAGAANPSASSKGWFYQAEAPVSALLNVRTAGQLVRDREAVLSFAAQWSDKNAKISLATFEFQGNDPPLSWQMNPAQIKAIQDQWHDRIYGAKNGDWLEVNCFFHPRTPECVKRAQAEKKGPW